MPEGDTIFRTATTLRRALAGQRVTGFESVYPHLNRIHHDHPLTGRFVESVVSLGKHLLITFSGDLTLHTHMRMRGSWHLYRPGERWQRPRDEMRLVIETGRYVAVGFEIPVADLLTSRQLARHPALQPIGPDLASASFDRNEAIKRIRAHGAEEIHDVLLDQRVMSGVGNVLKSEILFVSRVSPFTPVSKLDDEQVARLVDVAQRLMKMNTDATAASGRQQGRRTRGSLDPSASLWVYGRSGKPCRRCGEPLQSKKTGIDARVTYWCPQCQALT